MGTRAKPVTGSHRDPGPHRAEAERGEDRGEPVGPDIDARHIDAETFTDDDSTAQLHSFFFDRIANGLSNEKNASSKNA